MPRMNAKNKKLESKRTILLQFSTEPLEEVSTEVERKEESNGD